MDIIVSSEDAQAPHTVRTVMYEVAGTNDFHTACDTAFEAHFNRFGKQTAPNADLGGCAQYYPDVQETVEIQVK